MYVDLDEKQPKWKPRFPWMTVYLLAIIGIQAAWMPARDEAAANEAERAFYAACMAKEGEHDGEKPEASPHKGE